MNRKEIIALAEKVGLLVKDENFPYSSPAQQRLISRLEKFAAGLKPKTMSREDKLNLATNYYSEDWAIVHAVNMLEDYDS